MTASTNSPSSISSRTMTEDNLTTESMERKLRKSVIRLRLMLGLVFVLSLAQVSRSFHDCPDNGSQEEGKACNCHHDFLITALTSNFSVNETESFQKNQSLSLISRNISTSPERSPIIPASDFDRNIYRRCQNVQSLLPRSRPTVVMSDAEQKLQVVGAPKGGATVTLQMMLRHWNKMDAAINYGERQWLHDYRRDVLVKEERHEVQRCRYVCSRGSDDDDDNDDDNNEDPWLCIKIVRSVVDRAISSYIHTLKFLSTRFPELVEVATQYNFSVQESSFEMYSEALRRRASQSRTHSIAEDHFMPQADRDCDREGVYHIPLEGLTQALNMLNQSHGTFLNASGLTSSHYISKTNDLYKTEATSHDNSTNAIRISQMPFSQLFDEHKKLRYSYDSFFDSTTVRALFCQLHCRDIRLYTKMCEQPIVQSHPDLQQVCAVEQQRIDRICDTDKDAPSK